MEPLTEKEWLELQDRVVEFNRIRSTIGVVHFTIEFRIVEKDIKLEGNIVDGFDCRINCKDQPLSYPLQPASKYLIPTKIQKEE